MKGAAIVAILDLFLGFPRFAQFLRGRMTVTTAPYLPPSFSRRSRQASAIATGESFFALMWPASSRMPAKRRSSVMSTGRVLGEDRCCLLIEDPETHPG